MVNRLGERHTEYCEGHCGTLGEAELRDIPAGTAQPNIFGDRMHSFGWLCMQVSRLFAWRKVTLGSSSEIRAASDIRPAPKFPSRKPTIIRAVLIIECEPAHTVRKKNV